MITTVVAVRLADAVDRGIADDRLAPDLACDSPCIDQTVFGPTAVDNYTLSATTAPLKPPNEATVAWDIHFFNGGMSGGGKWLAEYVRAVRSGL